MKKRLLKILSGICVFVVLGILLILYQNTFDMKVTSVKIPTSRGTLMGNLVLPNNLKSRAGLVIFIHGDGPVDASYHGEYKPLWEVLAKHGYASLSWSKPGIGGSSGNWLYQTMDDRAAEAMEVLNWAKTIPQIDSNRIGLWGASQAGWVIPKIARKDNTLAFQILVAPAINWLDQGLYNTMAVMKTEGKSLEEEQLARSRYEWSVTMLEKNASFEEYHNSEASDKEMSEDRWNFIKMNYKSDSTEDIRHFYSPVKLILGGKDSNVDSVNTKEIFEKEVPKELLSVTLIPTTDHFMLRAPLVNSRSLTFLTAVFAPKMLADNTYNQEIIRFLSTIDESNK